MLPLKFRVDTQSEMRECHIFIAITNKVRSNKMIAIRRRTFIIKVLFFISIPPFFFKIGGRHSHQMFGAYVKESEKICKYLTKKLYIK